MARWLPGLLTVAGLLSVGDALAAGPLHGSRGKEVRLAAGPQSAAPAPPRETGGGGEAIGYRMLVQAGSAAGIETRDGIVVLDLPRPAPNPGPQPDIAITEAARGPDLSAVAGRIGLQGYDRTAGEPCRIDWVERCAWVPAALARTITGALRDAGADPSRHEEPYFYLSRFGPADRLVISRSAPFGDGALTIVNALADRDGRIGSLVAIPVSRADHGFDTGDPDANVAVLAAGQDDDGAVYLTIDTPTRCADRARKAGLVIKTEVDVATVEWVGPFNVSDTNLMARDGRIYTASGGSCENDYLYELDAATGAVTGRNVLPTSADFLVDAGDHLLLDLYEGAMAFAFR
ncbi:hypothetical protein [Aurantimonas sp. 22II-16-19i]|uniref:hypothetical protein n=1 Tax=Aurantimonas sp. 22II-16-19i TaxID=1317114 RepID=UPI0009F7DC43|nr:hypothetical protein [Aurantimonas sp. 22II-16-19i]ORE99139.1 hypothetical protein ATO4_02195 [Aurantimonas sp. 22II-16-19i]